MHLGAWGGEITPRRACSMARTGGATPANNAAWHGGGKRGKTAGDGPHPSTKLLQ
jgi:hypothetical protein